jgi:alpha-tubulin suppressor-like RCC1 family protein
MGDAADATALSCRHGDTAYLRADGSLWTVPTYGDHTPAQVESESDWVAISYGWSHLCGIRAGGAIWCLGDNWEGAFGNGSTGHSDSMVQAIGADWKTVSAGYGFTCGLRADGTLWCWGVNDDRELGDATTAAKSVPIQVGTDVDWTDVVAGASYVCALRQGGARWCWGNNADGQLGNGSGPAIVPTGVSR